MYFLSKLLWLFLFIDICVGYEYKNSKTNFEYGASKSTPKIDSNLNTKETVQNAVQTEYLRHYLNAYLARQAEENLDTKKNPEPLLIGSTVQGPETNSKKPTPQEESSDASTNNQSDKTEEHNQFIEEFKNGVRIIRRNQAESNSIKEETPVLTRDEPTISYRADTYRSDAEEIRKPVKEVWRG